MILPIADGVLTVLVLAPQGRDAMIATTLLRDAGLDAATAGDYPGLIAGVRAGAGAAVVTEEALTHVDLSELYTLLNDQPPWADIPIVLLTHRGGGTERNPAARRLRAALGNVPFWNGRFIRPRSSACLRSHCAVGGGSMKPVPRSKAFARRKTLCGEPMPP